MRSPKKTVLDWLDRLASEHGESTVVAVMASEWTADPDIGNFLSRVETSLQAYSRAESKAADERQRRSAIEEQHELEARLAAQTPEERARAAALLAQAGSIVKGMPV
jgi:hypothetical protein